MTCLGSRNEQARAARSPAQLVLLVGVLSLLSACAVEQQARVQVGSPARERVAPRSMPVVAAQQCRPSELNLRLDLVQ